MKPETTSQAPASSRTDAAGRSHTVRRSRLGIEIAVALCVKLLLLFALYQIWFSHPISKHLTERAVATALFGSVNSPLPLKERPDGSGP